MIIKKYDQFVNEELNPEVYTKVADIVRKKGQNKLAGDLISHSHMIERHGVKAYNIPINFKILEAFNKKGDSIVYIKRDKDSFGQLSFWANENSDEYKNAFGKEGEYNVEAILSSCEATDEFTAILDFSPVNEKSEIRDFFIIFNIKNGKLGIYDFNSNKTNSRRDANRLVEILTDLYENDIHEGKAYSFKKWIDENIEGDVNIKNIVDIRTLY